MKDCIIVLGMHRSGTSAVAGALGTLGVDLGSHLMAAREGENDRGYWEDREIVDCHEALLGAIGYSWDDIRPLPDGWWKLPAAINFRDTITKKLQKKFSGSPLWAIKDPRLCRLLPLWLEILKSLDCRPRFLVVYRHPGEVAMSLKKRNGFSEAKAAILWLDHSLTAEKWTRDYPRVFVPFTVLLTHPRDTLQHIGETLSVNWPLDLDLAMNEIGKFLDPGLKHHQLAEIAEISGLPWGPAVLSLLYAAMNSLAEGGHVPASEMDALGMELTRHAAAYDPVLAGHISNLQAVLSETRSVVATRTEWAQTLDARIVALNERNNALEGRNFALEDEHARMSWELATCTSSISWRITMPLRVAFNVAVKYGRPLRARLRPMRRRASNALHAVLTNLTMSRSPLSQAASGCLSLIFGADPLFRLLKGDRRFRAAESPDISVVIPVFNEYRYTIRCLASVLATPSKYSFEIIVVDDCSTDMTPEILQRLKNVRVVRNESNSGFVNSCNKGAQAARGKFLVFLNNDTEVTPRWLNALRETFDKVPDAGLVGAKLIYPSGVLQEAGGIIRRDGSGWNYGRGEDQKAPQFNFRREVDYCSGACLMISRNLFMQLDGFDTLFAPAYYEDTDLAFRARKAGKKILYQPTCVVIHHEGATCGKDDSSGVKQHMKTNRVKFLARWNDVLKKHGESGNRPDVEVERRLGRHVMVMDNQMLTPDRDSGSLRMSQMLSILQESGCQVTFVPQNMQLLQPYCDMLRADGIEVVHAPYAATPATHLVKHGMRYEIVILSRLASAKGHLDLVRKMCPAAKVVFDTVDLHFLRAEREAALYGGSDRALHAATTRRTELDLVAAADVTLVVSEHEKAILSRELPGKDIMVVSNIVEVECRSGTFEERRDIMFVGGFRHPPNIDAMLFFVGEVFPLVREKIKGIRFMIVGSDPPPEIRRLASEDVIITGYAPDLAAYFNRCRISVAPLRYGAGVKGKINSSLSYGVPVVATPMACEGMDLVDGVHVLTASAPDDFANAVVRLYTDCELWHKLSDAGMEHERKYFSRAAAKQSLTQLLAAAPKGGLRNQGARR